MASPDLARRNAFYVNYVGSDDAGLNAIGAPQPYLTLAAALAALAAVANPPSATNPWFISIGPGVFTTPAFSLPPWVWITGSPDGEGGSATVISLSGNVTLASGWNLNTTARGGFSNLVFRAASGTPSLDFTVPTPVAGNPTRTVELENVTTNLNLAYQATSTADRFTAERIVQDGTTGNTFTVSAGTVVLLGCSIAATVALADVSPIALAASLFANHMAVLGITKGAAACVVVTDAVSFPVRSSVTLTGAPTVTFASDAASDGYSPTVAANWSTPPTTVQEALDLLAGGSGGGGITNVPTAANIAVDFTKGIQSINPLNNDVTFSSANLAAGRAVQMRILCGAAGKTFTFPGTWIFVGGAAPAGIAASKNARLNLESWSTTDANVICAYAVEP